MLAPRTWRQALENVDRENDLVVVIRWIRDDRLDESYGKVLAALRVGPTA